MTTLHKPDKCSHCRDLDRTGECCHGVDCGCRNVYREGRRSAIARAMIVDHLVNRRNLGDRINTKD